MHCLTLTQRLSGIIGYFTILLNVADQLRLYRLYKGNLYVNSVPATENLSLSLFYFPHSRAIIHHKSYSSLIVLHVFIMKHGHSALTAVSVR